jgi:deazaflavin-dependent oxidoreductase (nitroreductase family)
MPMSKGVAIFARDYLNHVTRHVAGWAPMFGILIHTGRKSGRVYRTPINAFRDGGGYRFVLTYGAETDWLRNAQASGSCDLLTRGRLYHLINPQIVEDTAQRWLPLPARIILGLVGVTEYVRMTVADRTEEKRT